MRLAKTSFGLSGCLALLVIAACSSGSQNVASKYVASAVIGPEGGTIPVSASDDSTLAGTTIVIPKNALSTSTTISIGLAASGVSVAPSNGKGAGPVVDFEPSGTIFAVPVTITIPVTTSAAAKSVFIEAVESDNTSKQLAVQSITNGLATFQANGFTNFGAWTVSDDGGINPGDLCSTDADCSAGTTCVGGHCDGTTGIDAGADVAAPDAGSDVNTTAQGCMVDTDCAAGEVCSSGVCEGSTIDAGVDGAVNPGDLCSTNADCSSGLVCVGGHCEGTSGIDAGSDVTAPDAASDATACVAPEADCSGICADLDSDADNCGGCGFKCPSGQLCSSGACTN